MAEAFNTQTLAQDRAERYAQLLQEIAAVLAGEPNLTARMATVASMLANVSAAEGRQAWVEAPSICSRLRLGLAGLRKHRQVLAAVVAVEGL